MIGKVHPVDETRAMPELCEWDPDMDRPAQVPVPGERSGCTRPATEVLGVKGQWHLCGRCANLPRFNAFSVRHHRGVSGYELSEDDILLLEWVAHTRGGVFRAMGANPSPTVDAAVWDALVDAFRSLRDRWRVDPAHPDDKATEDDQ